MQVHQTKIYYPPQLRAQWPDLARLWARLYPRLFDEDDLRLVENQPSYHFPEWFAPIHIFHRDGALSLVEKYAHGNHSRKRDILRSVLMEDQLEFLDGMVNSQQVQPPDLFVYTPDGVFWFAEAKAPGDRLSEKQIDSHRLIVERLGVPVEIFHVKRQRNPSVRPIGEEGQFH